MECINFRNNLPEPLTEEQRIELIKRIQHGYSSARDELILGSLRLVAHCAGKKTYDCLGKYTFDELCSIGLVGLVEGIDAINVDLLDPNHRIGGYLMRCINNNILDAIWGYDKKVKDLQSFEDPIYKDAQDGKRTLEDRLIDHSEAPQNWYNDIYKSEVLQLIAGYIDENFTGKQREVVKYSFGFGGVQLSQSQMAEKFGITQASVSDIYNRAMRKIREYLTSMGFDCSATEKKDCDDINKRILDLYYGTQFNIPLSVKEISKLTGVSHGKVGNIIMANFDGDRMMRRLQKLGCDVNELSNEIYSRYLELGGNENALERVWLEKQKRLTKHCLKFLIDNAEKSSRERLEDNTQL